MCSPDFSHIFVSRPVGVKVHVKTVGLADEEMDSLDSAELNREDPHVVDDLDDDDLSDGKFESSCNGYSMPQLLNVFVYYGLWMCVYCAG